MKNNAIQPEDPDNWIWGTFYYNKNDKRIFPPKLNKMMGWTINFANPRSIIAFVVLVLGFVLLGFAVSYFFIK